MSQVLTSDSAATDVNNLDRCAQEQIHVPGAIQPHGALLALEACSLRVLIASESTQQVLGLEAKQLLGLDVEAAIGLQVVEFVRSAVLRKDVGVSQTSSVTIGDRTYELHVHRVAEVIVLEFEPCVPLEKELTLAEASEAFAPVRAAKDVSDKAMAAANALRRMSGYDRVMVYRFAPDWHGEVIGEARAGHLEPFLGLHYPASDIPAQARELYLRCHVRQIVDVSYQPSHLLDLAVRTSTYRPALDLSNAILRSVSPVHLQYLVNMGVVATLVFSIVVDGRLWGLVACHHQSPRRLSTAARDIMALHVRKLASEVAYAEIASQLASQRARDALRDQILTLARGGAGLSELARGINCDAMRKALEADGVAVLAPGFMSLTGDTPPESAIRPLIDLITTHQPRRRLQFFCTDQLARDFEVAPEVGARAQGLIVVPLGGSIDTCLVWFRSEQSAKVSWAGDPNKPVDGADGRISPRKSFAAWIETVVQKAAPWTSEERASAAALGYVVGVQVRSAFERELLTLGKAVSIIDEMLLVFEAERTDRGDRLRAVFANDAFVERTGRQREAVMGLGVAELLGGTSDPEDLTRLREGLRLSERTHVEMRLQQEEGGDFWAEIDAIPIVDRVGWIEQWVFVIRDVTARRIAEAALIESETRFRQIVQHLDEGVMLLAPSGEIVSGNDSAYRLLGWTSASQGRGRQVPEHLTVLNADGSAAVIAELPVAATLRTGMAIKRLEFGLRDPAGGIRWLEASSKPLPQTRGFDGRAGTVVVSLRDTTRQREAEQELHLQAETDALTELGNRQRLYLDLEQRLRVGSVKRFGILLIDLDDFKDVNDQHGHAAGDELLRQVAQHLRAAIGDGDLLVRLGGDEFVILTGPVENTQQVERLGAQVLESLDFVAQLGDATVRCSGSVGVAVFPNHGTDRETLLKHADTAMYSAKRAEHGTLRLYDHDHEVAAQSKITARAELKRAIEHEEFQLHYQPKVDIGTGRVMGFEALIRWPVPGGGLRSPADFIPIAETSGLIVPMGRWILKRALTDLARLRKLPGGVAQSVTMAVNLSARQFLDPGLVDLVRQTIDDVGVPPSSVQLELTESLIMEREAAGRTRLEALRALGVSIAVDDFGTGYSSLAYLHLLPIDTLKVDRAFVKGLGAEGSAAVIARSIVSLAKSLGLSTVAEGVETQLQRDELHAMGCDQYQGWLFSAAKPLDQIALMVSGPSST